ncbi:hypothetical protein DB346_06070 [Verrucomicrobia bacterium LW23]|nr:hypothetical protein DB346_06070 [Verrucomicrobia bacterium LW23]
MTESNLTPEPPRPGQPVDQPERERFIYGLDRNFSVIAPAGVGKTRSIVERIAAIAAQPDAVQVLPHLVVVTYTDRAAREMKRRARQRILQLQSVAGQSHAEAADSSATPAPAISPAAVAAFNQTFFGTIHSLCVKLLQTHGHFLGVPAKFEVADDDRLDELWDEFISNDIPWQHSLSEAERTAMLRHIGLLDVFRLSREVRLPLPEPLEPPGPVPAVPLDALIAELQASNSKHDTVADTLSNAQRFQRQMDRAAKDVKRSVTAPASPAFDAINHNLDQPLPGEVFCPLPERKTKAKALATMWDDTFRPLRDWLSRAATVAAVEIAEAFVQFRIRQGVLTFDDQVSLALELLSTPEIAARILKKPWRIILDEAQDTDPIQFQVLLRLARVLGAELKEGTSDVPGTSHVPADAWRWAMVGDFQQSIYGQRADIPTYRQHHLEITTAPNGAQATFQVTFRCSQSVVGFVNTVFPHVFAPKEDTKQPGASGAAAATLDDQARFVQLMAAATTAQGQVLRLPVAALPEPEHRETPDGRPSKRRRKDAEVASHVAEHVAHSIQTLGLEGLQASRWSEVAVLCPRIAWLAPIRKALAARGIDSQSLSTHDIAGDHPARAWLTALVWVMAEPLSGYEIVGVLRDIFGLPDHVLASFSGGDGARFQIASAPQTIALTRDTAALPVRDALVFLAGLREKIATMPVRTAVELILSETQLLERLELLPDVRDWPGGSMRDELEALLVLAAHAEAAGTTFRGYAHNLRNSFGTARSETRIKPDAVQLITSYKAKGLEWDAVVIPFMFREIQMRTKHYPRFTQLSPGQNPRVIFSRDDTREPERAAADRIRDMEYERLLYVMCTRPRRTLVLTDDSACWAEPKYNKAAETMQRTFARCMRLDKVPEVQQLWDALPLAPALSADEIPAPAPSESSASAGRAALSAPVSAPGAGRPAHFETAQTLPLFQHARDQWERRRELASRTAGGFRRRVTPHSLAKSLEVLGPLPGSQQGHSMSPGQDVSLPVSVAPGDPESSSEPEDARPLNAERPGGTEYGTWWHALMERLPWSGPESGAAARLAAFEAALPLCQLPERARREFDLLQQSELPARLAAPGLVLHAELPFLLAETATPEACLEGIIDMAWFDPASDRWTVLDWKTNFIRAEQSEELRQLYMPQLQAYARALTRLTGKGASAVIYSTTLGVLLSADVAE